MILLKAFKFASAWTTRVRVSLPCESLPRRSYTEHVQQADARRPRNTAGAEAPGARLGRRSTPSSRSGTPLRVVPYGGGAAAPPYGGRMGGLDFSGGLAAHAALPPHFDLLALFLWTIIAACFDVFVSVRREGLVFKHNYICPVARKNAETIASFRSTRRRPTGVARRIARARKKGTATGDSSAGKTEERLQRRPGRGARGAAAAGRQLGGDVHLVMYIFVFRSCCRWAL